MSERTGTAAYSVWRFWAADFIQEAVLAGENCGVRVGIVDKSAGWFFTDIIFRVTGPERGCKKWGLLMAHLVEIQKAA